MALFLPLLPRPLNTRGRLTTFSVCQSLQKGVDLPAVVMATSPPPSPAAVDALCLTALDRLGDFIAFLSSSGC